MDYGFLLRSIVMQVLLFSAIPFFVWLWQRKKTPSFFTYVGLYKPQRTGAAGCVAGFAVLYILVYGVVHFTPIAALTQPSASRYAGMGMAAVVPALLVCFVQQGLAEEILFRGFIGKRLLAKTGMTTGNLLQAAIFGAVHVLFSSSDEKTILSYAIIGVSTAAGGWLLGYLNEKLCNGSIFPGVLLHGLGNFVMILSVAF